MGIQRTIDGEATSDQFGYSIALSNDGRQHLCRGPHSPCRLMATLSSLISLPMEASSVVPYFAGCRSTENTRVRVGQELNGATAHDEFGASTSISGDGTRFTIGAPLGDRNGSDAGPLTCCNLEKYRTRTESLSFIDKWLDRLHRKRWFNHRWRDDKTRSQTSHRFQKTHHRHECNEA